MGRLGWLLIIFLGFFLTAKAIQKNSSGNKKVSEAEAYTQSSTSKDSASTDWWELDDTSLGYWTQETFNFSDTETNVVLWVLLILVLITILSYLTDLKAWKDKIKINIPLGITLIFIIGAIVYGTAFKGETVQNWLRSASNTSWFGNSTDTKQSLTFKKVGESKEVTMGIGSQLKVNLPAPIPNSGMVYKVCFQLIGPPVLAESKELPYKVLKNMDGERRSNTHNFVLDDKLGALMGQNAIGHVTIRATVLMGKPGNIPCPSN